MILFRCKCGAAHAVKEEYAGGTAQCDKCGSHVDVPEESEPGVRLVYHAGGEAEGEPMVLDEIPVFMAAGELSPIDLVWEEDRWVPLGSVVGEDMAAKSEPPGPDDEGGPLERTIGELQPLPLDDEDEEEEPAPEPSGPTGALHAPRAAPTAVMKPKRASAPGRTRKLIWVLALLVVVYGGIRYSGHRRAVSMPLVPMDIGQHNGQADTRVTGGTYTLRAQGSDIWGRSDECHFAYRPGGRSFTVTTRVTRIENVNEWTKAGIMIRSGVGTEAQFVALLATPGNGVNLQTRRTNGTEAQNAKRLPQVPAPVWLRLRRRGNRVTAWHSKDGNSWEEAGEVELKLPDLVYVGLCLTSHQRGTAATAEFTNYRFNMPVYASIPQPKTPAPQQGGGQGGQGAGQGGGQGNRQGGGQR